MKQNVMLVTVWDGGREIRTKALFDPLTGEVHSLESVEADVEVLENEFIEFPNGDTMDVCKTCHEYVERTVMVPGNTKGILIEGTECVNPDCESR